MSTRRRSGCRQPISNVRTAQIARLRALAVESGLDPVFTEKFLRFIVAEVIHHHQRLTEPDSL